MKFIPNKYMFAPKFSMIPDKICLYNEVSVRKINTDDYYNANELKSLYDQEKGIKKEKKQLIRKFHNFEISENAYRNLKKKITWLYYLAKSRHIKTHSGKEIYNFKMLFLTLTLPSKQKHNTSFITKNFFNQFITEMRAITKMKNFVWRLEFQSNGNVHYHIVTDTYIDYFTARRVWNRILEKEGYVSDYAEKFKKMNLSEYFSYITTQAFKYDEQCFEKDYYKFDAVAKRYALQKKEGFMQPNTIDVKSVSNSKKISSYISKYFGKNKEGNNNCNYLDDVTNSSNLRLWFCSRSLSKLKSICEYIDEINWSPDRILEKSQHIKYVVHQYCTVIYFEFSQLPNKTKRIFAQLFYRYAKLCGYLPAT
jgi:hypothetical protein